MKSLVQEKETALLLRRKGYSYNDILRVVPVAKSSISDWLKDLPLTEYEKRSLRHRKDKNISRGRIKAAAAHRKNREVRDRKIFLEAKIEFNEFVKNPFFQVGLALYWAEGTKRSWGFQFMNSDTDMMVFMIKWTREFLHTPKEKIYARLYIHKPYAHENCEQYWSERIDIPLSRFKKTVYKPTGLGIKKRPNYKGCLRIEIYGGGSSEMLRKIKAWQQCFVDYYQKS